jgi:hypothetical protein
MSCVQEHLTGGVRQNANGKWIHHAAQQPSGRLEWHRQSASRPAIAEKPEERKHSHQVGVNLGNPG